LKSIDKKYIIFVLSGKFLFLALKKKGGDRVSIEVIKKVTESEKNAQESKLEAIGKAKKTVSDAERAGQGLLTEARGKAETQAKQFMKEAEEKAAKNEQSIMDETAGACEALKLLAKKRLPEAAELIVRRVVNV
jgi:V/A-type H+-transporting ATPase subunit G/H